MNGRDRLLAALRGEIPDRVPVSLFVQEEFLGYFYCGRKTDRVSDAVDCARTFGFDVMTRSKAFEYPHFMKKSFPNWELDVGTRRENGIFYRIFTVRTPTRELRQVEAGPDVGNRVAGIHLATTEYLIKDEADLEVFLKYVPRIDKETADDMKAYCSWSKKEIGGDGISVPWTWGGIYNQASVLRDVSLLMTDPYDNEGFYRAYMDKLTDLMVEYGAELAKANGDALGIQGNIANSAMLGKDFFEEYVLPYEKRLNDAIREAGSFTVYHNCGRARVLQESYVKLGLTAWETVAQSPQGDNDLGEAKRTVGERITLIGNLDQVVFLKTASPAEAEKRAAETTAVGKPGGRYIFACSDFLEQGTPLENVRAAVRGAKAAGAY